MKDLKDDISEIKNLLLKALKGDNWFKLLLI
jgi:hypothetical protein